MNNKAFEERLNNIEKVLGTMLVWISQTADRTLSPVDCEELLRMLNKKPPRSFKYAKI